MGDVPRGRGRSNRIRWVGVVLSAVVALAGCSLDDPGGGPIAAADDREVIRSTTSSTAELERTTTSTSTTAPPTTAPPGVVVEEVVDGDTIRVEGGVRVRLIGIDAPDRDDHGFVEARDALVALLAGRRVVLVPGARDDVDRYGRLLRYVEVDGVDVNLELLKSGRVRARYDSRDGYGRHAREDAYIAADAAAPDLTAAPTTSAPQPPPTPAPQPFAAVPPPPPPPSPPPSDGGTDPQFGTCREAIANGFGNYRRGIDPEYDWYRDADGDGIVCE